MRLWVAILGTSCGLYLSLFAGCSRPGLGAPGAADDAGVTPTSTGDAAVADLARSPDLGPQRCGTKGTTACPANMFCEVASCDAFDVGGACRLKPMDCAG